MNSGKHFELLASYNQWMNGKLYAAAGTLSPAELTADRGAFFGSVLGTLNHIVVADRVWLQRFARHPACESLLQPVCTLPVPGSLDQLLFSEFAGLAEHRQWLDELIRHWVAGLSEADLGYRLSYRNMKGVPACRQYASLMLHFFNHQTHHRGQITTLLSQAGLDVGTTDLLELIADESRE